MDTTVSSSSPLPETLPLGLQLQQLREDKYLTLEEVSFQTKISRANLEAIESMAYDKLPADPFTRGQLILYGNFLGMDGRLAADHFFSERDNSMGSSLTASRHPLIKRSTASKRLTEPARMSSASIAGILLLVIVTFSTLFCYYFSWNPFAFLLSQSTPASSDTASFHPADPATHHGSQQSTNNITALFSKDCRILVSLDDQQTVEQFYTKGSQAQWQPTRQLKVEFFQSDSAELQLNGAVIPFPDEVDGRFIFQLPAAHSAR
ncbi:MAG: hypothetical protein GXY53_01190 [Desulfobulbus sp.]|nr:hypothetical protein [Desulfobulbus sp.]